MVDVPRLARLVSARQKDDQLIASRAVVNTVSRPGIDPQFADACADGSNVARISVGETPDPPVDTGAAIKITQAAKPRVKNVSSEDLHHRTKSVIYRLQTVKDQSGGNRNRAAGLRVGANANALQKLVGIAFGSITTYLMFDHGSTSLKLSLSTGHKLG